MEKIVAKLVVFFEEPFWVGIYERECKSGYEVCKITFGAEPRDYQVYDFLLQNWNYLQFSPTIETERLKERRINPKRRQREIRNQVANTGMGTKAQQALKLQQEQGKLARKKRSREQRQEEKERQFLLHQEKRKAKHRGH